MSATPVIFVVVGTPGSGKDLLIQAVNDMGILHCRIVPKHTDRGRQADDSNEMICCGDLGYDLSGCDLVYRNFDNTYGVKLELIWNQLRSRAAQVIVVSNPAAIDELIAAFGTLVKLVFVHSAMDVEKYRADQLSRGNAKEYVERRVRAYNDALSLYYRNIGRFDHVLIYADSREDLFDQIFRLFTYYERS